MKGLTYIATDRGPLRSWLKKIGREDDQYDCGVAQSAAHIMRCPLVGDGKGRAEEYWNDQEWCEAVADFLAGRLFLLSYYFTILPTRLFVLKRVGSRDRLQGGITYM